MAYSSPISGIYTITHTASGRVYVGSAQNIHQRWNYHRSSMNRGAKCNPYLGHAWKKYGEHAFAFRIVEIVDRLTDLIEREQYWIDHFDSAKRENGFNIAPKAGSNLGKKPTPETIAKIVAANTGKKRNPESRQKIAIRLKGNKNSMGKHNGRLTDSDILPIFQAIASRVPLQEVADRFNVHTATIRRVISRNTWYHVPIPDDLLNRAQSISEKRRQDSLRSDPRVTTLSTGTVAIIKARLLAGETGASLAREYGVTDTNIYSIKQGRIWKDIIPAPPR